MKTTINSSMIRIIAILFIVASCNKEITYNDKVDSKELTTSENCAIIPIEKAVQSLNDFLEATEGSMTKTTSGTKRKIASIDKYYHNGVSTKSTDAISIPDAYIINFENNEGFAVLGAHSWQDEIIAVTEKGSIDPVTLEINPGSDNYMAQAREEASEDFDWYCPEDDDFYFADSDPTILTQLIDKTIIGGGGTTLNWYTTKSPMLSTNWSQGYWDTQGLYNYYCYKGSSDAKTYVCSGCTTTAMAMIIAENKYPQSLVVNNTNLSYDLMTRNRQPLGADECEHVNLLLGAIFKDIDYVFATSAGTCITAVKAKERFEDFGYTNVEVLSYSDYSDEMTKAISDMLREDKPVFISAISGLTGGHSWVIDGAKYHNSAVYLLHCNWGWSGDCNGYFSSKMFSTQVPYELDEGASNDQDLNFTWHFRVITYDLGTLETLYMQTL